MKCLGIISEYNPFHTGHAYHIAESRRILGETTAVISVMSGNFVQRGDSALADKWTRTRLALAGGVDLVLELPTPWATASAEGFALGAVHLLSTTGVVDVLSFGSEGGDLASLCSLARALDGEDYQQILQVQLSQGVSFPVARARAMHDLLGEEAEALQTPNNNLGIEYLRAIKHLHSPLQALTVQRQGVAHDSHDSHPQFLSASQLRQRLLQGDTAHLCPYLTEDAIGLLQKTGLASLQFAQRGVFARLRSMTKDDFLQLPDCKEGLENLLYKACRESSTLEALYASIKSKRYTHARIRRLVLSAFLGITAPHGLPPYLRVLGMNERGKQLLKEMKQTATLPILSKASHVRKLSPEAQAVFAQEAQCTLLFDLCRAEFGKTDFPSEYSQSPVQSR